MTPEQKAGYIRLLKGTPELVTEASRGLANLCIYYFGNHVMSEFGRPLDLPVELFKSKKNKRPQEDQSK